MRTATFGSWGNTVLAVHSVIETLGNEGVLHRAGLALSKLQACAISDVQPSPLSPLIFH